MYIYNTQKLFLVFCKFSESLECKQEGGLVHYCGCCCSCCKLKRSSQNQALHFAVSFDRPFIKAQTLNLKGRPSFSRPSLAAASSLPFTSGAGIGGAHLSYASSFHHSGFENEKVQAFLPSFYHLSIHFMPYLMIFQNTYIAVPFGELHFENKHVYIKKPFFHGMM